MLCIPASLPGKADPEQLAHGPSLPLGALQDFRDKNEIGVCHRGPVDKVMYCEAIDRYITCSR